MAIIVNIGERRNEQPVAGGPGFIGKWLEKPLFDAEMHRVIMSRVDHPGQSNESVIYLLYVWAVSYIGISTHWFVKYIIS